MQGITIRIIAIIISGRTSNLITIGGSAIRAGTTKGSSDAGKQSKGSIGNGGIVTIMIDGRHSF